MARQPGNTHQKQHEINTIFDYDAVKESYFKEIRKLQADNGIQGLFSQKRIDDILKILKQFQEEAESQRRARYSMLPAERRVVNRFMYSVINGKCFLYLKKGLQQVIATEDTFDVLLEVHLSTVHGGRDKMQKVIKPVYYIYKLCLQLIVYACNVCNGRYIEEPSIAHGNEIKFNGPVSVGILEITESELCDGDFQYVLIYKDLNTNFILLRPLTQKNDLEVALELIKIAADFGEPEKFITRSVWFFEKVMNVMKTIGFSPREICLGQDDCESYWLPIIINWMEKSGSKNWSIGCYEIQYEINTTKRFNKYPYHLVFDQMPNLRQNQNVINFKSHDDILKSSYEDVLKSKKKPALKTKRRILNPDSRAKKTKIVTHANSSSSLLFSKNIDDHTEKTSLKVNSISTIISRTVDTVMSSSTGALFDTNLEPIATTTKLNPVDQGDTNLDGVLRSNKDKLQDLRQQLVTDLLQDLGDINNDPIEMSSNEGIEKSLNEMGTPVKNRKKDMKEQQMEETIEDSNKTYETNICQVCHQSISKYYRYRCDRCKINVHERCGDWRTGVPLPNLKSVVVYICNTCKARELITD